MNKPTVYALSLFASAACLAASDERIATTLRATPKAELPTKIAELIAKANPRERELTATVAVCTAIEMLPAATVTIVSSAVRADSTNAPTITAAAATSFPDQIENIVLGVTLGAPGFAEQSISAIVRHNPQAQDRIASAVSKSDKRKDPRAYGSPHPPHRPHPPKHPKPPKPPKPPKKRNGADPEKDTVPVSLPVSP
jgi:hypothetical protein